MAAKQTIALVGNPNCGKTTVFNALTGARQHVGNWPGVTVERKHGEYSHDGHQVEVVDLPGTYSLDVVDGEVSRSRSTKSSPATTSTPTRRSWWSMWSMRPIWNATST